MNKLLESGRKEWEEAHLDTFNGSIVGVEEERFPSFRERIDEFESVLICGSDDSIFWFRKFKILKRGWAYGFEK
jgi:hypothetical protein